MAEKVLINISTMEAIANWIRSQKGTSAGMLPSEMVAALSTIMGLPSGLKKLTYGTFTPSSTSQAVYNVAHGLGEMPDFYIVYDTSTSLPTEGTCTVGQALISLKMVSGVSYCGIKMSISKYGSFDTDGRALNGQSDHTQVSHFVTDANIVINPYSTSSGYYGVMGKHKYKWICGKFA